MKASSEGIGDLASVTELVDAGAELGRPACVIPKHAAVFLLEGPGSPAAPS